VSGKPTTISGYGITDSPQPASQAEAEAAADNAKFLTSLRAKQQIDFRIASQAVAEAGVDNSALMTSLRVKQAIAANTVGGMTLLGTLNTTSGTTQTLSGLVLAGYKQVLCVFNGVSSNSTSSPTINMVVGGINCKVVSLGTDATAAACGMLAIDLDTGVYSAVITLNGLYESKSNSTGGLPNSYCGDSNLNDAATSITFSLSTGSYDGGNVKFYGVK
jgi:hypothetical protein